MGESNILFRFCGPSEITIRIQWISGVPASRLRLWAESFPDETGESILARKSVSVYPANRKTKLKARAALPAGHQLAGSWPGECRRGASPDAGRRDRPPTAHE